MKEEWNTVPISPTKNYSYSGSMSALVSGMFDIKAGCVLFFSTPSPPKSPYLMYGVRHP